MTLYQGHSQEDSPINLLPKELLHEICSEILPATPILAKMTEILARVLRAQSALKLANISEYAKQFNQDLQTPLAAKTLIEKAAKIKSAIDDFLQQELKTLEAEKAMQSPAVALLSKYYLIAEILSSRSLYPVNARLMDPRDNCC